MSFNFINTGGNVSVSSLCAYDSNVGYGTDFSENGNVNGWTLYDGICMYGCWNNFIFGTLYGETSMIGRHDVFKSIAAEQFYTIKIVMKLNIVDRIGTQNTPEYGKIAWTTKADPSWSSSKEINFIIYTDSKWHTYNINMGEIQWWQGDINNLKLYPILQDGRDGDEFFVLMIQILSIDTYKCINTNCEYFSKYQHPCKGVGERGTCTSKALDPFVQEGTIFDFAVDKKYTIIKDINDELLVNINGYGYESIRLPVTINVSGAKMAKIIAKEISKINVGGYSEVSVEYNANGQFIIYSGTSAPDSTVTVGNSSVAVSLSFYNEFGVYQAVESSGQYPASGYRPNSSFKINTHQLLNLFDNSENQELLFNPFVYNIEGGRRDWLETGLGIPEKDVRGQESDSTGLMNRYYETINNTDKTIIDFNHPFNASGRITKIYAAVTLDNYENSFDSRGNNDSNRIATQLENAEIMFFRPLKNGDIKVLDITVPIINRDHVAGNLYSASQEYTEIDCDVFVNKGDLIGIYNANVYKGRSVSGVEVDALFYQVSGKANGILNVGPPLGDGGSGLLIYARSCQIQDKLIIDIDLSKRLNIENITIVGDSIDEKLEYNIARCLDVNWQIDLFDEDHTTGYKGHTYETYYCNHPNIFYGKNCLVDGIKIAPDGLAGTSFSIEMGNCHTSYTNALHKKDGGAGVIVNDPRYFHVNGDHEWFSTHFSTPTHAMNDYKHDPIAFTLLFPGHKKKNLSRLKIYFKERYNFRSFALSFFKGDAYCSGTADDLAFDLIPYRIDGYDTPWTKLILDGSICEPEDENKWAALDLYLAHNPVIGHEILDETNTIINNDQNLQSLRVDWTTLSIEWPESKELGFRLYCDYHESTKICEMELFCSVEDIGSSMAGATSVIYSVYGKTLWLSETSQDINDNIIAFIEDTPRYITVEISPITKIKLRNINVNIGEGDFFLGEKGCQSEILPVASKINTENVSVPVVFKNTYGYDYDLYVDIIKESIMDKGLVFYSRLNNSESIIDPEVGSSSYYKKSSDYSIVNNNYNIAINCPVYGLKNLVDGAEIWYSHDNKHSWKYFGTGSGATEVDFTNLPVAAITVLNVPVLKRSKWWKIGFLESNTSTKVMEIHLYYQGVEIQDVNFYHHKNQSYINGGNIDTSPHLDNNIIDGSYYILTGDQYIGMELPGVQEIDQIVIYHEFLEEYENTIDIAGIDRSTAFNLKGYGNLYQIDTIYDYGYYEHGLEIIGNSVCCDNRENLIDTFSFVEDFSNCPSLVDWDTNTEYDSVFTCSSGIAGEDYVYEFDVGISDYGDAAGYRKVNIHDLQYNPIDQRWSFEFKFKINLEYVHDNGGNNTSKAGISVGILNAHREYYSYYHGTYDPSEYFEGAQMLFGYDKFGISIKGPWAEHITGEDPDITTTGLVYNTTYYCIFQSDGNGNYIAKAWTDNWDGINQVCDLVKITEAKWAAGKVGVGTGWNGMSRVWTGRGKGWVADFDFNSSLIHKHNVFNGSSIRFNNNSEEYLKIDYDNSPTCNINRYGFDFSDKYFTIDTFIKFESLPLNGEMCVIASCWKPGMTINIGGKSGSSWALVLENISDTIRLKFYIVENGISDLAFDWVWNPDVHRWYHFYLCRAKKDRDWCTHYAFFVLDDHIRWSIRDNGEAIIWDIIDTTNNSIEIGKNFNGWLQEFRISSDTIFGGMRLDDDYWDIYYTDSQNMAHYDMSLTPTKPFERYYTFQLYISDDNEFYGLYGNVDCLFNNSFSYHEPSSSFSQGYYTYFALDLGHRYNLGIIRSFPVDEAHLFNLEENVQYSNINDADPSKVFKLLCVDDISTEFSGLNYSIPDHWFIFDGVGKNYISDNKLVQCVENNYVRLRSDFYLMGDFDFEIEYELIETVNQNYWSNKIQIQDVANSNNKVKFERVFYNSTNSYRFMIQEDSPDWVNLTNYNTSHQKAVMRLTRVGQMFTVYIKNIEEYVIVDAYETGSRFGKEVMLDLITQSGSPDYPNIKVEWDNLRFNYASPIYSTHDDTRWVGIKMWNGDGVIRTVKRIGIYPDVSVQVSADNNYNTEWESLGNSITNYVGEENVALNAHTEASSFVGLMVPGNIVNGFLTSELQQAWGSEDGSPQWVTVKLPQEMQIYRVKLYLGYDSSDTNHMIQDYKVQISIDNITFEDVFVITGNNSFSRTHDLLDPVTAAYVRIYITSYTSKSEYIQTSDGYAYWSGANIRQIEIYEYYGNTIISSEDYPIIAIDLKQSYFIRGHSMVGVDTENSDIDWDNDDSNYTYSNSNLAEPKKVLFGDWAMTPHYEKWVVIKRNTATHYPLIPDPEDYPYRDTEDYLKHVIIQGSVDENETKPNPVEHCWMWKSNISELGYSYDYVKDFSIRSLSIKYPASNQSDHIHFIEGDDFGIDESFSWRDGLAFYWYIDDIEHLDLGYGHIYFGGYDSTKLHNPVIHKWYLSTLSGTLQSGWNDLTLVMNEADEIECAKVNYELEPEPNPRRLYALTLQKLGMVFRGKGQAITMYMSGFTIQRNHFEDMSRFDYGLYLCDRDILKIGIGELNLHGGTLEFFIRPDWNFDGMDICKDFKFRSLFYFSNVANDVFGATISMRGIEVYYGNIVTNFNLFIIPVTDFNFIDRLTHMAFIFSNDGTNIGSDNSTIRVYINNVMVAKSFTTWKVSDEKYFNFIFGGQSLLIQKNRVGKINSSSVDGVISNIRIYNYCKIDFTDSINSPEIENMVSLVEPNELIEISKDNLTFYKVDDAELPFYFKNVSQEETIPVYVRTTIPNGLTGKERRTAELLGQWDIGV